MKMIKYLSGSYSLNLALQYENAAVVALVRNVDIAIAFAFDVLILNHEFSVPAIVGSGLVAIATVGKGFLNTIRSLDTNENYTYSKLNIELEEEDNCDL